MRLRLTYFLALPAAAAMLVSWSQSGSHGRVVASETWNSSAAAHRMDARQTWWMNWPKARRDHDTACISCHTALPYALARPMLRGTLGETGPSSTEQEMLGYVKKRVTLWDELEPYYGTKSGPTKPVESRGTEPVLNALVLARYDLPTHAMSPLTEKAFSEMWAMQVKEGDRKGAWEWLNFHLSPWEANESPFFGASLAAIAVGETPVSYKESPQIQGHLDGLRAYLKANYDAQPLLNRVMYLWASSKVSGMMTAEQKTALLKEVCERQAEAGDVDAIGQDGRRQAQRWLRDGADCLRDEAGGGLAESAGDAAGGRVAGEEPECRGWAVGRLLAEQAAGPDDGSQPVHVGCGFELLRDGAGERVALEALSLRLSV